MKPFDQLADDATINKTIENLAKNGITAVVAQNAEEAKLKLYELLPEGSEIMIMTSETLRTLGVEQEINSSPNYVAIKKKISEMDSSQGRLKKQMGAAPEIAIGSVHAVTQDGTIMIASNTGSQLAAYVYGADKVVWAVGAQKLVKDFEEGKKRIYEYILPKETIRLRKAYNLPETVNSNVSKLLIFDKEVTQKRVYMVIIKEILGF